MDLQGNMKRKAIEDHADSTSESSESEYSELPNVNMFEESSESEPELECSHWDTDCKILGKLHTSDITGFHLMPTCSRDPDLNPSKKQKVTFDINKELLDIKFVTEFQDKWQNNIKFLKKNVELLNDPFKLCIVNNFIENVDLLSNLREEMYELDWNNRNMDLYEFYQSKDLKYLLNYKYLQLIYTFLKTNVIKWVSELCHIEFSDISATCSLYNNTDYLLVHDDQREDRKIAFILYLTGSNGWSKSKGGALQLFNKDENGHPCKIVREIFPLNNQLVFFPVANDSYHQVAEVTTMDDSRISINGWFHVKTPPTFITPIYQAPTGSLYNNKHCLKPKQVDIDLEMWINDDYLHNDYIKQIHCYIEENSEIALRRFFKQESFNAVLQTLNNDDLKWLQAGPPNRYNYEILDTQTLPHSLERFLNLFQSYEMINLLHRYTDLDLLSSTGSMKFELQKWTAGCYSLLTDYNWQEKNELDLIVYFGCSNSKNIIGARTQYVTMDDEIQNALITIEPEENNLNIVYRDLARFTKYFSKQSTCKTFYCLVCSYSE